MLEVRCAHCQRVAVTASLAEGVLTQHGFIHCQMLVAPERVAALGAAIDARDVAAMHALWWEYAPYFCRQCRAPYCSTCWHGIPEFDDGFYDCTRGTCPAGHAQTIDD